MGILFFVTGTCGVGKSSIVPFLKRRLPNVDVHDFDDVGVPAVPTIEWRKDTTRFWISKVIGNANINKSTAVIGLSLPQEVKQFLPDKSNLKVCICLLDVNENERVKRLRRRDAPKMLIDDAQNLIGLRKWVPESGFEYTIIDTTDLTIEQTGKKVLDWIVQIEDSR